MGERLGKQEIRDIREVYSFDFFSCRNVFGIKLDMTFSRLPEEKYFLIPEGPLGKWNSWATRLARQGLVGSVGPTWYSEIHRTGSEVCEDSRATCFLATHVCFPLSMKVSNLEGEGG